MAAMVSKSQGFNMSQEEAMPCGHAKDRGTIGWPGAVVQYVGQTALFSGTKAERKRAKDWVSGEFVSTIFYCQLRLQMLVHSTAPSKLIWSPPPVRQYWLWIIRLFWVFWMTLPSTMKICWQEYMKWLFMQLEGPVAQPYDGHPENSLWSLGLHTFGGTMWDISDLNFIHFYSM